MSKKVKLEKYSVEHGKIYKYSPDHRGYLYLTNTFTLKHHSGFKRISEKNVAQAVGIWEDALLMQEDQESYR